MACVLRQVEAGDVPALLATAARLLEAGEGEAVCGDARRESRDRCRE
ncbi:MULTISPECIES: hypothetical protein [Pseudonocardia]|uniref:Uncharacterized protein n=1 Tax=Pseudonocardia autotrophica TaxID=2074 RepID=A0A1Y2MHJ4_PSEAH|nr:MULTISPECIES: hypothetical protein [Pseudonocardia]OSY34754.1 hypothetical protein BG845_06587 [Pseudonocardia autotrophica]TDN65414.1 hypothetical protein C8E95_6901 [Pseudonocardia autotrophica]